MRPRHLIFAASLASVTLLPGCVAVPIAAALNAAHQSGTAAVDVAGPERGFPAAFRTAVQRVGGMVTATTPGYGRAVFSRESVRVEYQKTSAGHWQLMASSDGAVARAWDFSDSITAKSQAVADGLAAAGYTVTAADRQRGL